MNWREIIIKYAGYTFPLSNGWGVGQLVGTWELNGKIHALLAWPSAQNPTELFNEDWKPEWI
jgi:hypothetical protein